MFLDKLKELSKSSLNMDNGILSILESGLILDEDVEILLNENTLDYYKFERKSSTNGFPNIKIIISNVIAAGGIFIMQQSALLSLISLSPTFWLIGKYLIKLCNIKKYNRNVANLVNNLRKLQQINVSILNYLKQRRNVAISPENDDFLLISCNKNIQELVKTVLNEECGVLELLLNRMDFFYEIVATLKDEYCYLENFNPNKFDLNKIENLSDCILIISEISDAFVLISSNFLTCLAIILTEKSKYSDKTALSNFYYIFSKVLPKSTKSLNQSINVINQLFDSVKSQPDLQNKFRDLSKNKLPSKKLNHSLNNCIIQIPLLLEKSQFILKQLNDIDVMADSNKIELARSMRDLTNQTYKYYESLDILCKLYEISLNLNRKNNKIVEAKEVELNDNNLNENLIKSDFSSNINLDCLNEDIQTQDEEYELYIGENDHFDVSNNIFEYDDEESRNFLSLMTQELKQSLKSHEKFVAARKKRGIVDEGLINGKVDVSKSNLNDFDVSQTINDFGEEKIGEIPAPPPMLKDFEGFQSSESESFLDSIKNISGRRGIVEDTFGDSFDDSSD